MTAPPSPLPSGDGNETRIELPRRVTRWEMPILLRIAMVIFTFMGAGFALFTVIGLPSMLFGGASYTINDVPVTKEEFMQRDGMIFYLAVPMLAL